MDTGKERNFDVSIANTIVVADDSGNNDFSGKAGMAAYYNPAE